MIFSVTSFANTYNVCKLTLLGVLFTANTASQFEFQSLPLYNLYTFWML